MCFCFGVALLQASFTVSSFMFHDTKCNHALQRKRRHSPFLRFCFAALAANKLHYGSPSFMIFHEIKYMQTKTTSNIKAAAWGKNVTEGSSTDLFLRNLANSTTCLVSSWVALPFPYEWSRQLKYDCWFLIRPLLALWYLQHTTTCFVLNSPFRCLLDTPRIQSKDTRRILSKDMRLFWVRLGFLSFSVISRDNFSTSRRTGPSSGSKSVRKMIGHYYTNKRFGVSYN